MWHHSCTQRSNTAHAVPGSQKEMLTAVLKNIYLLLWNGSHEDMQLFLQDKGERNFLRNPAVFSTSIPLCLRHSLSAITHQHAQTFPVAFTWNNTMKKALLHIRQCSDTALHDCNTVHRLQSFTSCYGQNSSQFTLRSVDTIGFPLEIHWHGPGSHMMCPS